MTRDERCPLSLLPWPSPLADRIVRAEEGLCLPLKTDSKHLREAMTKHASRRPRTQPPLPVCQPLPLNTHCYTALSLRFNGVLFSSLVEVTSTPQTVP